MLWRTPWSASCAGGGRGAEDPLTIMTDDTSSLRSLRTSRTVSWRGICSRMTETDAAATSQRRNRDTEGAKKWLTLHKDV
jgi:hypothetical protein